MFPFTFHASRSTNEFMSDILNRTISWEEGDMGATRDDFIKYPRTPHLFGSKGTDDDKQVGREESEAFIAAVISSSAVPVPG